MWKICHRLLSRRHKKIGAWSEAGRRDAIKINDMSRRNAQRASCAGVVLTSNPHCDATMPEPGMASRQPKSIWQHPLIGPNRDAYPLGGIVDISCMNMSHDSLPDKNSARFRAEHWRERTQILDILKISKSLLAVFTPSKQDWFSRYFYQLSSSLFAWENFPRNLYSVHAHGYNDSDDGRWFWEIFMMMSHT